MGINVFYETNFSCVTAKCEYCENKLVATLRWVTVNLKCWPTENSNANLISLNAVDNYSHYSRLIWCFKIIVSTFFWREAYGG